MGSADSSVFFFFFFYVDSWQVDPDAIMGIYRDYVIPLTKEVEVDYLLQRLRSAPQPPHHGRSGCGVGLSANHGHVAPSRNAAP